MARPPKTKEESRSKLMQVRLQGKEYQSFKDAAELAGLDLSAWARAKLIEAARKEMRNSK